MHQSDKNKLKNVQFHALNRYNNLHNVFYYSILPELRDADLTKVLGSTEVRDILTRCGLSLSNICTAIYFVMVIINLQKLTLCISCTYFHCVWLYH